MGAKKYADAKKAYRAGLAAAALQAKQPDAWLPADWHPSQLPAHVLRQARAGVSQVGHLGRLQQVLARMRRSEPIVISALGNSVTADFGGIVGSMQDRFKLGFLGSPRRCKGQCVQYGWLLPIYSFLTERERLDPPGAYPLLWRASPPTRRTTRDKLSKTRPIERRNDRLYNDVCYTCVRGDATVFTRGPGRPNARWWPWLAHFG